MCLEMVTRIGSNENLTLKKNQHAHIKTLAMSLRSENIHVDVEYSIESIEVAYPSAGISLILVHLYAYVLS